MNGNSTVPIPVAMISSEAEYLGECAAAMALSHLKMLLYDFENLGKANYDINESSDEIPPVLLVDNEATVAMSKYYKPTKKSRHIARRYHYVREGEKNNYHNIKWIPGEDQLADDLTKTQSSEKSKPHVDNTLIKLSEDQL